MGMEKVETAVLNEAKAETVKIVENARKKSEELIGKARVENEKFMEDSIRHEEIAAARETARQLGLARQEGRLEILKAKNELIDDVFNKAMSIMSSMPEKEYSDIIEKWLLDLAPEIGGVIRINPKDTGLFSKGFLDNVNGKRQPQGKFTGVEPDEKISGGFIVDGESFSADCTFEKKFDEFRKSNSGDIAKELFNT